MLRIPTMFLAAAVVVTAAFVALSSASTKTSGSLGLSSSIENNATFQEHWDGLAGRLPALAFAGVPAEISDDLEAMRGRAKQLASSDKYSGAVSIAQRMVELAELRYGPEHLSVAASLDDLAELHRAQGHFSEAEPLYKRALAIKERVLGPEHPTLVRSLNSLAALYQGRALNGDAALLAERAIAIVEKTRGRDHPDLVTSLTILAYTRFANSDAEVLLKRALGIVEKVRGPEHSEAAEVLHHLGTIYAVQGRFAEANPLFSRAGEIRKRLGLPARQP